MNYYGTSDTYSIPETYRHLINDDLPSTCRYNGEEPQDYICSCKCNNVSLSNIYTIIYNYYIYTHTSKHQSVQHSTVIDEFPYVSELHSMFPNKKHRTY